VRVEHGAGEQAAAGAALREAESLADELGAAEDSELGKAVATLRELLAGGSAPAEG